MYKKSGITNTTFALVTIVLLVGAGAAGSIGYAIGTTTTSQTSHTITKASAQNLRDGMKKLWEDHITWTRVVIVNFAANSPGFSASVDRLLQNQKDIGDAIKPFYGEEAGNKLTALLTDHIKIAAEILTAAKAGDKAAFDNAVARWNSNADDVAAFLSSANPKEWPLEGMKSMMRGHLELTLKEAAAELKGDYKESIATYDQVHTQILGMADMLSSGIIQQFPQKFH